MYHLKITLCFLVLPLTWLCQPVEAKPALQNPSTKLEQLLLDDHFEIPKHWQSREQFIKHHVVFSNRSSRGPSNPKPYTPPYEPILNRIDRLGYSVSLKQQPDSFDLLEALNSPRNSKINVGSFENISMTDRQKQAATKSFKEYLNYEDKLGKLAVAGRRKLSDQEKILLGRELLERGAAHLAASGIPFTIELATDNGEALLKIGTQGDHPLAVHAAKLSKKGLTLVYNPFYLIRGGAAAFYNSTSKLIGLGFEDILKTNPAKFSNSYKHELRHAVLSANDLKRIPSPWPGRAHAVAWPGFGPGELPKNFLEAYSKEIGFNEINTHAYNLSLLIIQQLRSIRKGSRKSIDISEWDSRIRKGVGISQRVTDIADDALHHLKPGKTKNSWSHFKTSDEMPMGHILFKKASYYAAEFPLFKGSSTDDLKNQDYLVEQATWLKHASLAHLSMFQVASKMLSQLEKTKNPGEQTILLKAMLSLLMKRHEIEKNQEVKPITFKKGIALFNKDLNNLWREKEEQKKSRSYRKVGLGPIKPFSNQ